MDYNLEKIYQSNLEDIQRGRCSTAITQAKDYLVYILTGYKMKEVNYELDEFANRCRQTANENKSSNN